MTATTKTTQTITPTSRRHCQTSTVLGELTLVADDDALVGAYFPHHWRWPKADVLGAAVDGANDPVLPAAAAQIEEYLAGDRTEFELRTATSGDPFAERVWQLLRTIPYGVTTTYGALAGQLGDRALAQAVGRAVGDNPISMVVPCHRVVGSDGSLTGYAGGLDRKRFLLDLEEPAEVKAGRLF